MNRDIDKPRPQDRLPDFGQSKSMDRRLALMGLVRVLLTELEINLIITWLEDDDRRATQVTDVIAKLREAVRLSKIPLGEP